MRSPPVKRYANPGPRLRPRREPAAIVARSSIFLSLLGFVACGSPRTDGEASAEAEADARPVRPIGEVLGDSTDAWMTRPGVTGTALGLCDGTPCIVIYASRSGVADRLPEQVDGHPVDVRVTGPLRALGPDSI